MPDYPDNSTSNSETVKPPTDEDYATFFDENIGNQPTGQGFEFDAAGNLVDDPDLPVSEVGTQIPPTFVDPLPDHSDDGHRPDQAREAVSTTTVPTGTQTRGPSRSSALPVGYEPPKTRSSDQTRSEKGASEAGSAPGRSRPSGDNSHK